MLNYDAMKRLNLNRSAALLVLVAVLSACSGPEENTAASNANAPQKANNNSGAPAATPGTPTVQPIPPPSAEKSGGVANANASNASNALAANNAPAPKLVVSDKKIDFGKQPQGKTLVRAIVVKNGGRAALKIESVVPS